jgi:hypothetical protein
MVIDARDAAADPPAVQQRFHTELLQDRPHFALRRIAVDRDSYGPKLQDGQEGRHERGRVGELDGDRVALPHAGRNQLRGERFAARPQSGARGDLSRGGVDQRGSLGRGGCKREKPGKHGRMGG